MKFNDAQVKLNDTVVKLKDTQEKLETTRKIVEKFDTRIFIWKINNFSEILRQAKTDGKSNRESTPFYTDRSENYGYKIKVKVFPNGDWLGKNSYLSVYIIVMKGEYDAILPWPFRKKVRFTLIDQQEDPFKRENFVRQFVPVSYSDAFARPVKEENPGCGCHKFLSHEQLHSRRYIVDDTLFLQVEISQP